MLRFLIHLFSLSLFNQQFIFLFIERSFFQSLVELQFQLGIFDICFILIIMESRFIFIAPILAEPFPIIAISQILRKRSISFLLQVLSLLKTQNRVIEETIKFLLRFSFNLIFRLNLRQEPTKSLTIALQKLQKVKGELTFTWGIFLVFSTKAFLVPGCSKFCFWSALGLMSNMHKYLLCGN